MHICLDFFCRSPSLPVIGTEVVGVIASYFTCALGGGSLDKEGDRRRYFLLTVSLRLIIEYLSLRLTVILSRLVSYRSVSFVIFCQFQFVVILVNKRHKPNDLTLHFLWTYVSQWEATQPHSGLCKKKKQ